MATALLTSLLTAAALAQPVAFEQHKTGQAPLANPHARSDYAAAAANRLDERLASEANPVSATTTEPGAAR